MIIYNDFKKLNIRVGKVESCEPIAKAKNLLLLSVDIGEDNPRTIISGIKEWYTPEQLIGKKIIVLTNLKPRTLFGITSQGMLLAADVDRKAVLLKLEDKFSEEIDPGAPIE